MRHVNTYDALVLAFLFAIAYMLGIHSAIPKDRTIDETAQVKVVLRKTAELPQKGEICTLDKTTILTVTDSTRNDDTDTVTFVCTGKYYDAGFLSSGGKYLCANQPVSVEFKDSLRIGRIIVILPSG